MRTTIDLPPDLLRQAMSIARDNSRTLSETVADLIRRGLGQAAGDRQSPELATSESTGLPVVTVGRVITSDDVRALEDGVLLDANALIALTVTDHVHHEYAQSWLESRDPATQVAMCPITQGALVRMLLRTGVSAGRAQAVVAALQADPRYEFWPDVVSYAHVTMAGVIGRRQVTDAYLAELVRDHEGRLATFDRGLAALHDDISELIPIATSSVPDER